MRCLVTTILILLFAVLRGTAQCSTLGQAPQSAFPVCGTSALQQVQVPPCPGRTIRVVGCASQTNYRDVNAFWYKFTCYEAGTLGFSITPADLNDDYDWQLFDVTGRNLNEVYTNINTQVGGNWSAIQGVTGASSEGTMPTPCEGYGQPKWSKMPTLVAGHQYLLMISNFSESQSGYSLSFQGGTANITDPLPGAFKNAVYRCLNNRIGVKLNKRFQCSTLTAGGTEFEIVGGAAGVTAAQAVGCNSGFDMDSVVLELDRPLPPGNYTLRVRNGGDGNTLLDACNNPIAAGREIAFTIPVPQYVPFDRIRPAGCEPDRIKVLLSSPVLCSSIAADGSDFRLSGTGPAVSIVRANTFCSGQLTDSIELILSGTVYRDGNYRIDLVRGSDGSTLISECGVETPLGFNMPFITRDTVNALFAHRVRLDCEYDTIFLQHDGAHGVNDWKWSFEDGSVMTGAAPEKVYSVFGMKTVKLVVSNGVCSDEHSRQILLDNELKAEFTVNTPVLCPLDMASFTNGSIGNIVSHSWDFDFGPGSRMITPQPFRYPIGSREQTYRIRLIVEDNLQCRDTVVHTLKTVPSCRVAVPTAFSPNNDGINDFLYPLNGYKTADLTFRVYARNGQLIFETRNWQQKWDGKINGSPAGVGTYAWVLEYTDTEMGNRVFQKGVTTLVR